MTHSQLVRLNRIFGDKLGRIPPGYPNAGESAWQYKRSSELYLPFKCVTRESTTESGIILVEPEYRMELQLPGEDRWVIARWRPPGWLPPDPDAGAFGEPGPERQLSPQEYEAHTGGMIGWCATGTWICITPLRPGCEPDEDWTTWAADTLALQRDTPLRDAFRALARRQAKLRENYRNEMVTMLRETCWLTHLPGKRGANYLAFNEPPSPKGETVTA